MTNFKLSWLNSPNHTYTLPTLLVAFFPSLEAINSSFQKKPHKNEVTLSLFHINEFSACIFPPSRSQKDNKNIRWILDFLNWRKKRKKKLFLGPQARGQKINPFVKYQDHCFQVGLTKVMGIYNQFPYYLATTSLNIIFPNFTYSNFFPSLSNPINISSYTPWTVKIGLLLSIQRNVSKWHIQRVLFLTESVATFKHVLLYQNSEHCAPPSVNSVFY